MRKGGRSPAFAIGLWALAAILLALAVVVGRAVGGALGDETLALLLGFAGGAVLASLADTLMPEAFVKGRPLNAFATAAGFFVSFILAG
jgi:ZIP family zinc transporter